MIEQQDNAAREREEIVSRVASFKATQEKFEREREEYFVTTLQNARGGFEPHLRGTIRGSAVLVLADRRHRGTGFRSDRGKKFDKSRNLTAPSRLSGQVRQPPER